MNQLERNVIESFRMAKSDIIKLQNKIIELSQAQKSILEKVDYLKTREALLSEKVRELGFRIIQKPVEKTIVKEVARESAREYVGSRLAKKFHLDNCPFAQNIKPKTRITFSSKTNALNEGYKPCHCVK